MSKPPVVVAWACFGSGGGSSASRAAGMIAFACGTPRNVLIQVMAVTPARQER